MPLREDMANTLTPTAFCVVTRALDEGRIVLMSVDPEPGASGRFPGQDFQRLMREGE